MRVIQPLEKIIEVVAVTIAKSGEEVVVAGSRCFAEGACERDSAGGERDDPAAAVSRVGLSLDQFPCGKGVEYLHNVAGVHGDQLREVLLPDRTLLVQDYQNRVLALSQVMSGEKRRPRARSQGPEARQEESGAPFERRPPIVAAHTPDSTR